MHTLLENVRLREKRHAHWVRRLFLAENSRHVFAGHFSHSCRLHFLFSFFLFKKKKLLHFFHTHGMSAGDAVELSARAETLVVELTQVLAQLRLALSPPPPPPPPPPPLSQQSTPHSNAKTLTASRQRPAARPLPAYSEFSASAADDSSVDADARELRRALTRVRGVVQSSSPLSSTAPNVPVAVKRAELDQALARLRVALAPSAQSSTSAAAAALAAAMVPPTSFRPVRSAATFGRGQALHEMDLWSPAP